MERVAGTVQFVGDIERRLVSLAGSEIVSNDLEMPLRLFRKDIQQHRIHFERWFFFGSFVGRCRGDGEHRRIRVTLGKRIGPGDEQPYVGAGTRADFKLLDQLRNCSRRLDDEIDHRGRAHEGAIDQLVEQVFHTPAVFADALRTDHAAAALERME